jgi:hypothetical protein
METAVRDANPPSETGCPTLTNDSQANGCLGVSSGFAVLLQALQTSRRDPVKKKM